VGTVAGKIVVIQKELVVHCLEALREGKSTASTYIRAMPFPRVLDHFFVDIHCRFLLFTKWKLTFYVICLMFIRRVHFSDFPLLRDCTQSILDDQLFKKNGCAGIGKSSHI
jgi:hypothetical protein